MLEALAPAGTASWQEVIDFWFQELEPSAWFNGGAQVDAVIQQRFTHLLHQAAVGELQAWRTTAWGRLAEILVLDQFSRNIYRNSAQAFAQDSLALVLSQEAIRAGALTELQGGDKELQARGFLLMPFMHSESKYIHQLAAPLFKQYASAQTYDYELRHQVIIERFGRYPHRNALLQRQSTTAELEFLQEPGSSF